MFLFLLYEYPCSCPHITYVLRIFFPWVIFVSGINKYIILVLSLRQLERAFLLIYNDGSCKFHNSLCYFCWEIVNLVPKTSFCACSARYKLQQSCLSRISKEVSPVIFMVMSNDCVCLIITFVVCLTIIFRYVCKEKSDLMLKFGSAIPEVHPGKKWVIFGAISQNFILQRESPSQSFIWQKEYFTQIFHSIKGNSL